MRYFNEASVSGDCGFMDQQAALRWVQRSIARFGGNPSNVTIAGEFAGGTSVLAQLVSPGACGLFERAIVESGSFALKQTSLADAETAGEAFAAKAGCADQTAALDLEFGCDGAANVLARMLVLTPASRSRGDRPTSRSSARLKSRGPHV